MCSILMAIFFVLNSDSDLQTSSTELHMSELHLQVQFGMMHNILGSLYMDIKHMDSWMEH